MVASSPAARGVRLWARQSSPATDTVPSRPDHRLTSTTLPTMPSAQVNGCRGEIHTLEDMRRRIELDLFYIDNWSLWFDLRILLRTAVICFRDEQAY